jgi:hypothetical protein
VKITALVLKYNAFADVSSLDSPDSLSFLALATHKIRLLKTSIIRLEKKKHE